MSLERLCSIPDDSSYMDQGHFELAKMSMIFFPNNYKRVCHININQRSISNNIKVRLIVKDFTHNEYINHNEIFFLIKSLKIIFTLVGYYDFELHHKCENKFFE